MAGHRPTKVPIAKGWDDCIAEHERRPERTVYFPVIGPSRPEKLYDWQRDDDGEDDLPF